LLLLLLPLSLLLLLLWRLLLLLSSLFTSFAAEAGDKLAEGREWLLDTPAMLPCPDAAVLFTALQLLLLAARGAFSGAHSHMRPESSFTAADIIIPSAHTTTTR
jgi:hypothetical protein